MIFYCLRISFIPKISYNFFVLQVPVNCGFSVSRHVLKYHSKIPNHYDTLGVPETANQKLIKEAFKKLSKKHHPDHSSDKSSHSHYLKIREAYSVLGESLSRKEYDLKLHHSRVDKLYREPPATPKYPQASQSTQGFEWHYGYWRHHAHNFEQHDNSPRYPDNKMFALSVGLFLLGCGTLLSILRYNYIRNSLISNHSRGSRYYSEEDLERRIRDIDDQINSHDQKD